jgi:hypothetical protein
MVHPLAQGHSRSAAAVPHGGAVCEKKVYKPMAESDSLLARNVIGSDEPATGTLPGPRCLAKLPRM